ncbi:hypothetical protein [Priestia megaterium]|uniref:hypothetical protein n=1 Tax=Priestia megaterium TaxID=1404 RepID=UPI001F45CAE2|nr:hypothetical protein [Priestia megaterium]
MKKILTSIVAFSLFLGIGTAAFAHSNSAPIQGNGNLQQMINYCSEIMNSFINNHQNNIQH